MQMECYNNKPWEGLPPHGGSGLKYLAAINLIMMRSGLPPHGGSGLK